MTVEEISGFQEIVQAEVNRQGKAWRVEYVPAYGVVVYGNRGMVTADPRMRQFALGMAVVHQRGPYKGQGWGTRLAHDALKALEQCEVDNTPK